MIKHTIEEIILEINLERNKSKDNATPQSKAPEQHSQHLTESQILLPHQQQVSQPFSIAYHQPQVQNLSELSAGSCSQRSCKRNTDSSQNQHRVYRKKWTKKEEQKLCDLIGRYGSDFTFLQGQFSNKTRKQLKKKYQEIHKNEKYLLKIDRIEESIMRERRKSLFDDEIMELSSTKNSEPESPETYQHSDPWPRPLPPHSPQSYELHLAQSRQSRDLQQESSSC